MKQYFITNLSLLILHHRSQLASSIGNGSGGDNGKQSSSSLHNNDDFRPQSHPIHARTRTRRPRVADGRNSNGDYSSGKRRLRGRPTPISQYEQQQQSHHNYQQHQTPNNFKYNNKRNNHHHRQRDTDDGSSIPANTRNLNTVVSATYLTNNPWYPNHDALACSNDGNPPSWMTWEGGYAEAHLFKSGVECCERWFPDVDGCWDDVAEVQIEGAAVMMEEEGGDVTEEKGDAMAMEEEGAGDVTGGSAKHEDMKEQANTMIATVLNSGGKVGPGVEYNGQTTSSNNARPTTATTVGNKDVSVNSLANPPLPPLERPIAAAANYTSGTEDSNEVVGNDPPAQSSFDELTVVQQQQRPTADGGDNNTVPSESQQYLEALAADQEGQEESTTPSRGHGVPTNHNSDPSQTMKEDEETFPTSSCGTGWSDAATCSQLCLNGYGCPPGQDCYPGVPCPASQVATAMGDAGSSILALISGYDELKSRSMPTNVCGVSYVDAESKCRAGEITDDDPIGLGFAPDFVACPSGTGAECPKGGKEEMQCYGGIVCPLPPTISPAPTHSPVQVYAVDHAAHGKNIVAYYAAWQYYDRQKLAQPRNLNYDMVTRINYAFFQADGGGNVWGTDKYADPIILFGDVLELQPGKPCLPANSATENGEGCYCYWESSTTTSCNFHDNSTGLINLAHTHGVDVYPSIGGWTLSESFPMLAASRVSREKFAESCVELILGYGFDGIDIDWEYPGYTDHGGTPNDTENFIMLLETVRSALDALGSQTGKYYGLTAALPCGPPNIANQDIVQVVKILDELNLMTYDFHGSWDAVTGHNAPLYDQPKEGGDPEGGWSVHGCVGNWVGSNSPTAGAAEKEEHRSKVNIGLPFYGRSYLDTTTMYSPHGGSDIYSWYDDDGSPQYFNILSKLKGSSEMTSVRDDVTKTEYAYFNDGYGMVSYDDPRSICDKAQYAIDNGLGGFIIWEISGDMMDDFRQPLLEAVNRKLALPDIDCKSAFGTITNAPVSVSNAEPVEGTAEELVMRPAQMTLTEQPLEQAAAFVVKEKPIIRGDKTDVLGVPVVAPRPPPASRPIPVSAPLSSSESNGHSPYTIDKSTFGSLAVAADTCVGGCPDSSTCVGNSAGGQLIKDEECTPCGTGQTWWPCDVDGLCWCWADGTDRIAPAPGSGVDVQVKDQFYTVCDDILSRDMFHTIAPKAQHPYTYKGLCDAILSYNAHHSEKAFGMGDVFTRTAELAAFLGNTLHESDEFQAGREYLMCADNKVVDGEVFCKPCDPGSFDWGTKTCNHSLVSGTSDFNEYCQPSSKPPEACLCGNGEGASGDLEGYVAARHLFFGRGAIQLSWNYNYIGASVALTGSPDTFCDNPDIVATEGKYAWGAGLYFWMEHVKEGTTSHMEALKDGGDFGGTLNNINGGLECPAHGGWHVDAVKARLNRYCRAAKSLGLPNIMRLDNCAGLQESMDTCLPEGLCDDCKHFVGTTPGEHVPTFTVVSPASAPMTTTTHDVTELAEEPASEVLCPEGLMPWEENPDCCVPNSAFIGDGACDPEAPYNTPVCGFDGGDCCKETCNQDSTFGCKTKEGDNLAQFGPFGFFCLASSQGGANVINSILCDIDEKYRIGDGQCNPMYNTPECNYDGGDCCKESCDEDFSFYPCGSAVQLYVCIDPRYKPDTKELTSHPISNPNQKAMTSPPTRLPQEASTNPPTRQTVEISPPNIPSSGQDQILEMICPKDMMECPNGEYKSRNPENKCAFDLCPEPPQEQTVITVKCKNARKECPGGTFVGQDPANKCKFFPCPEVIVPQEEGAPQEMSSNAEKVTLASSIATAMHEKNNYMQDADVENDTTVKPTIKPTSRPQDVTQMRCKQDVKECSGGSFVGRDPTNHCKFFDCPIEDKDSSEKESSLAATINSSLRQGHSECDKDVMRCPNGSFVGRDPDNGCEFHSCSTKLPLAASVSSSLGQSNVVKCTDEVKRCPNGSFVSQDPYNGCEFHSCSTKLPLAASVSSSLGQSLVVKCTDEVKRCPNGSFVSQDPDNGCQYFACPVKKPSPQPTTHVPTIKNANTVTMAGTSHGKGTAHLGCTNELFRCADGHYVGQDLDNNCEWYPCLLPPTKDPTQKPTDYQLNSLTGTLSVCKTDLWTCSDGSFVGRDPDNGCKFFQCSGEGEDLEQMSAVLERVDAYAGAAHHKKKTAHGGADSNHRKKNNSKRHL